MRHYKRHSCEHVVTGCSPTALTMNYDERMMTSLLLFSWLSIASAETEPSVPTEPNDGDNPVSTEEEANASESENESPDGAESDSMNASDASDEPVENPENNDTEEAPSTSWQRTDESAPLEANNEDATEETPATDSEQSETQGEDEESTTESGDGESTTEGGDGENVEAPPNLTADAIETAELAQPLDKKFFEFLKPSREKLAQNPYGNTEYTAYALEFGQLRVGINKTAFGIAPRVQVGTAPVLNLVGIYNGSIKINALRANRVDLAIQGGYYGLDAGLDASWLRGGIMTSIRLTDPWSLHLGSSYDRVQINGLPEPSKVSDLLIDGSSDDLAAWEQAARDQGISLELGQSMITARMATDYRFNRRDALVFQASAIFWSSANSAINGLDPEVEEGLEELPPVLNMDNVLLNESNTGASIGGSYMASLAYQRSRKHLDIRIGLGISAIQYAWLLQSFELSYHFGGKTRRDESKLKQGWRRNKRVDG